MKAVTLKQVWQIIGQLTSNFTQYKIEESEHVFVILKNGQTDTIVDKETGNIVFMNQSDFDVRMALS
jgi:hypothetical protein